MQVHVFRQMHTVHAFTLDDTVLMSSSEVSANKSLPSGMLYDRTNVRLFHVETLLYMITMLSVKGSNSNGDRFYILTVRMTLMCVYAKPCIKV